MTPPHNGIRTITQSSPTHQSIIYQSRPNDCSKEDLIGAAMASVHIPYFLDRKARAVARGLPGYGPEKKPSQ